MGMVIGSTRRNTSASFRGLSSSSSRASKLAFASSKKCGTRCERMLAEALLKEEIHVSSHASNVPGKPDFIVASVRLAIFVDGDFWHGRNLQSRLRRLRTGANPAYWTAKILSNVRRDRRLRARLRRQGWSVMRVWETDVFRDTRRAVRRISRQLAKLQ